MNNLGVTSSAMPYTREAPVSPLPQGEGQGEGQKSSSFIAARPLVRAPRRLFLSCVLFVALSLAFLNPLVALIRLAASESLFSHLPLIPFVAAYLLWLKRNHLKAIVCASPVARSSGWLPALCLAIGGAVVAVSGWLASPAWKSDPANYTSVFISAYVCFIWALGVASFGWSAIRAVLFPVAFLVFMVPFPTAVTHAIESFFQHTSAEAAAFLFGLSQTPVLRDGLFFHLPGITLQVAQECSGIRSSLVLFVTSLVAGYMFFELKRYRAFLALAVIPIGIIRNGLRILTIGLLCVHFGPDMIHSIIHRKGGPLFFALSLIPFAALLLFLYRRERRLRRT